MTIPKQLKSLGFCRIKKGSKAPFEKDWNNKPYTYDEISKFFPGENYGVLCGYHDLAVIDCDKEALAFSVKQLLPETFSVKTGGGGTHFYYYIPELKQKIILNTEGEHLGEIQFKGQQVVGSGSLHPNGKTYDIINNVGIKTITLEKLKEVLGEFMGEEKTEKKEVGKVTKEIAGMVSFEELLKSYGLTKRGGNWNCPFHKSEGEQCLSVDDKGIFNCFDCGRKGNIISFVSGVEKITIQEALQRLRKKEELKPTILNSEEMKGSVPEPLLDFNLFENINREFDKQITGEHKSRKAIFLSLCSIWVKNTEIPLNTFVSSESSAGKSFVCKKVIKILPKNLIEYRSKITGEAFTYWHTNEDDWTWDGKICYLEDVKQDVLDSATFKLMCSEGSIATIVRNQKAVDLSVNGKPCMLVTTAGTSPSTELLNRFSIISLDESAKQTKAITFNQALEIKDEEYNQEIIKSLEILKRENISVPFAPHIHNFITENYSWNDVRMRRDFSRLRDLIKCSASLHQFQRERDDKGRLIAIKQDYEIARECINYIQTTTLKGLTHKLKKVYDFCIKEKEFTAKDIHSNHPIVSMAMWYRYLDDLCERGMLITELRESPESKKRVTHYIVPKSSSFNLPSYEKLTEYSIIDTSDTNDIIDTNDINDKNNSINYINSTTSGELKDVRVVKI